MATKQKLTLTALQKLKLMALAIALGALYGSYVLNSGSREAHERIDHNVNMKMLKNYSKFIIDRHLADSVTGTPLSIGALVSAGKIPVDAQYEKILNDTYAVRVDQYFLFYVNDSAVFTLFPIEVEKKRRANQVHDLCYDPSNGTWSSGTDFLLISTK